MWLKNGGFIQILLWVHDIDLDGANKQAAEGLVKEKHLQYRAVPFSGLCSSSYIFNTTQTSTVSANFCQNTNTYLFYFHLQ